MGGRSLTWFDERKLFPGEALIHESQVRLHIDAAPYRWDGVLILTSRRLFFLPHVDNPALGTIAYWVDDVRAAPYNAHAFFTRAPGGEFALFEPIGSRFDMMWKSVRVARWLRLINEASAATQRVAIGSPATG